MIESDIYKLWSMPEEKRFEHVESLIAENRELRARVRELEAELKQTVNEKMEMWENVRKLAYQRDWLAAWISQNVVGTKEYWIERATKGAENE